MERKTVPAESGETRSTWFPLQTCSILFEVRPREPKQLGKKKCSSGARALCSHQREMSPKFLDAETATVATAVTELAKAMDLMFIF